MFMPPVDKTSLMRTGQQDSQMTGETIRTVYTSKLQDM